MDRLSSYAAREAESESPEDRKQNEEEATSKLMERMRISKETKHSEVKTDGDDSKKTNGDHINGEQTSETPATDDNSQPQKDAEPTTPAKEDQVPSSKRSRGIPEDVKLYEIFYEQVINLVNAQRLHIQDTVALLVSLSNLAL